MNSFYTVPRNEEKTTTTTGSRRTTTTTSRSSTSTTNSTREASELYLYCLGQKPTPLVQSQLQEWSDKVGITVLRYALEEAASAPRPSWRYALAILRSCEGIKLPAHREGLSDREAIEVGRAMLQTRRQRTAMSNDDETYLPL